MNEPNYYREFAKSGVHGGLLVGLAAAFAVANPLVLMTAAAGYALAWVYAPTSGPFVRSVQSRIRRENEEQNNGALAEFVARRDTLVGRLGKTCREKYYGLSSICAEVSGADPSNTLVNGKLQELLWTYLKMLLMKQGIEGYLEETDEADIDRNLRSVEGELKGLTDGRLKVSKEALRETLLQHKKTLSDARENRQILESETTRLEHEIQLLRADAVANRNSEFLSAKIDASVESLQESKNILLSMGSVQEMSMDIPSEVSALSFDTGSEGKGAPQPIATESLADGGDPKANRGKPNPEKVRR